MTVQIHQTDGFSQLGHYLEHGSGASYVADPSDGRVAWTDARNLLGEERGEIVAQMRATARQSERTERPVLHVVLSWKRPEERSSKERSSKEKGRADKKRADKKRTAARQGELFGLPEGAARRERAARPTREEMQAAARRVLTDERVGLAEHQAWIVAHEDTATPHVHLMVNAVNPYTWRRWDDAFDRQRFAQVLRDLEREHGWAVPRGGAELAERGFVGLGAPPEHFREHAAREASKAATVRQAARRAVGRRLLEARSWAEVEAVLAAEGLGLKPRRSGFVVTDGERHAKMSSVTGGLSRRGWEARFGQSWAAYREEQAPSRAAAARPAGAPATEESSAGPAPAKAPLPQAVAAGSGGGVSGGNHLGGASESTGGAGGAGDFEGGAASGNEASGNEASGEALRLEAPWEPPMPPGVSRRADAPDEVPAAVRAALRARVKTAATQSRTMRGFIRAVEEDGAVRAEVNEMGGHPSGLSYWTREAGESGRQRRTWKVKSSDVGRSYSWERLQAEHGVAYEEARDLAFVQARRGARGASEANSVAAAPGETAREGSAYEALGSSERSRAAHKLREPRHAVAGRGDRGPGALAENERALAWAEAVYRETLKALPEGHPAKVYLRERGITEETQERFGVGFAPEDWRGLQRAARRDGISLKALRDTGLVHGTRDGERAIDLLRSRVVFPVRGAEGRPRGFAGRQVAAAGYEPGVSAGRHKYINTSESEHFKKSELAFGLSEARASIQRHEGRVMVVEGYVDAMRLHQEGQTNAVALMGTRLSGELAEALEAAGARQATLALDGDGEGQAAARRGQERLVRAGIWAERAELPEGMDPDGLLGAGARGRKAFARAVAERKDYVETAVTDALARSEAAERAERRASAYNRLLNTAAESPTRVRERLLERLVEHDRRGRRGVPEASKEAGEQALRRAIAGGMQRRGAELPEGFDGGERPDEEAGGLLGREAWAAYREEFGPPAIENARSTGREGDQTRGNPETQGKSGIDPTAQGLPTSETQTREEPHAQQETPSQAEPERPQRQGGARAGSLSPDQASHREDASSASPRNARPASPRRHLETRERPEPRGRGARGSGNSRSENSRGGNLRSENFRSGNLRSGASRGANAQAAGEARPNGRRAASRADRSGQAPGRRGNHQRDQGERRGRRRGRGDETGRRGALAKDVAGGGGAPRRGARSDSDPVAGAGNGRARPAGGGVRPGDAQKPRRRGAPLGQDQGGAAGNARARDDADARQRAGRGRDHEPADPAGVVGEHMDIEPEGALKKDPLEEASLGGEARRLALEKRAARLRQEEGFAVAALEKRFEDPERAKAALEENRRRHGDARGIDSVVRPQSYDEEHYARPGPVRAKRQFRSAPEAFERQAFALEEALMEERLAERIAERIAAGEHTRAGEHSAAADSPREVFAEELAEEQARGYERAVGEAAGREQLAEDLGRLEALAAEQESQEALRGQAARARARFRKELSQVYARPERALERFEQIAAKEGFERAVERASANPRSIGVLKGTEVLGGWKTSARKAAEEEARHLYKSGGNHLAHAAAVSALRGARLGSAQAEEMRAALAAERGRLEERFAEVYCHPEAALASYRQAARQEAEQGSGGAARGGRNAGIAAGRVLLGEEPERFGNLRGGKAGFLDDEERMDARRAAAQADRAQGRIAAMEERLQRGVFPSAGAEEVLAGQRARYERAARAQEAAAGGPDDGRQGFASGREAFERGRAEETTRLENVGEESGPRVYGEGVARGYREEVARVREELAAAPSRGRLEERAAQRREAAPRDARRRAEKRIEERLDALGEAPGAGRQQAGRQQAGHGWQAGGRAASSPGAAQRSPGSRSSSIRAEKKAGRGASRTGGQRAGKPAGKRGVKPSAKRAGKNARRGTTGRNVVRVPAQSAASKAVGAAALATAYGASKKAVTLTIRDMGGVGQGI